MSIAGTYRGKPYRGLSLISYFLKQSALKTGIAFLLNFSMLTLIEKFALALSSNK